MASRDPIKIVSIGGGTGLSTLLCGLKRFLHPHSVEPEIQLTAIVTVTDDGESSGRLRTEFDVLPPGDIRNCLVALADEANPLTALFRHRFPGDGSVGGHSLGNLLILALHQLGGNFLTAIEQAGQLLGIRARVLPSTLDRVDLVTRLNGKTVRGQVAIKSQNTPICELAIDPPDARALPASVAAIYEADLITLGPGSLFTSVIANLLVKGAAEALAESRARKIYICNAMTEFDETDGFSAEDHVRQLLAYAPALKLDYALFNSTPISAAMLKKYEAEKARPIVLPLSELSESGETRYVALPLISESRAVRHDPELLSRAIFDIYAR
ncbi:MAG: gluconeogenesis factor YvcK family protein [Acidobacteriota bacterium]|nr:gluconeogenesis factor YvcK family protein [Acidobacteriota bacterium]